jgi:hypothetical protein
MITSLDFARECFKRGKRAEGETEGGGTKGKLFFH